MINTSKIHELITYFVKLLLSTLFDLLMTLTSQRFVFTLLDIYYEASHDWYNSNFEIVGTGSSYTFTVTEETTGTYSCTVNSLGEVATSGNVEVSIEYPPSVEPEVYIWTTFTDVIFNPMDPPQQISVYGRAEIPGADSLEYHWQESNDGENWEFIDNESYDSSGLELMYTVRSDGMKYYRMQVIDQDTHETFISNVVTINVTYVS